jgi:hypothetical protein
MSETIEITDREFEKLKEGGTIKLFKGVKVSYTGR